MALLEEACAACSSAAFGDAVVVFASQESLCEGREADDAATVVGGNLEVVHLGLRVEHGTAILTQQTGHMRLFQDVVALLLQLWRILRYAHIECFSLPHKVDECLHGLLDGGHTIISMAVEDVEILQACPLQTLVTTRNQVLPATARAIYSLPHVVPSLRRDEHLIAMARQLILEDSAEVCLRRAWYRPIVVRQIEVADARIERPHHHLCGYREVVHTPKVVP